MRFIGLTIAAVPIAFAVLRAATTGTDFRYLWLALASTLGAGLMLFITRSTQPVTPGRVVRGAFALLAAAGATAVTAFALGGGSLPALVAIALGFATCSATGLMLTLRPSRPIP